MESTAALTIRRVPIASLNLDPANARSHGERNLEAIRGSLARFGQAEPLVVQQSTRRVIGGNGRLVAMKSLGWTECDVVELDVDDLQATALGIALNRTGELAEWDLAALGKLLESLQDQDAIDGIGFDEKEIEKLLDEIISAGESIDGIVQDESPAPPDEATTRAGDLWILGRHRLLCGDSSLRADVDRLLAGTPIHLVNTDPPYNVKVEPRSNNAIAAGLSSFGTTHHQKLDVARFPGKAKRTHDKLRPKDRPLANDFVSDEDFARMLRAWFGNLAHALVPGRGFYIWGGYANCANYPSALAESGLYFSQSIIWVKEHPVLTRKDFMGNHEWCQPPGTRVLTPDGDVPIESLTDSDRVVSFARRSSAMVGLRDGCAIRTTRREYEGSLYGVVVGNATSWCTEAHPWTAKLTPAARSMWCVYLMRRGAWWRVGRSKLLSTWGFGLKQRMSVEGAEAAWILSVHESSAEATCAEQVASVRYGIPTTFWNEVEVCSRTSQQIAGMYERLDLNLMERMAREALRDHHRCIEWPFAVSGRTRAKYGCRVASSVRACNLLPGAMAVPVPGTGPAFSWATVRAVDVQPYHGPVFSMDVEKYHHYVADGIVTHNCFYGWREGAAHVFLGPNNAVDVWSVKKLNHTAMVHLTEKPVELAARAIQYGSRPEENILDLFGGSGSTLIAAEQTGRNAYLMELDPLYCDVIIERWQKFSGKDATLDGGGETFAELRSKRSPS